MNITDFLRPTSIISNLQGRSKVDIVAELASSIALSYPKLNRDKVIHILMEREKLGSTGIENGVAIPHGKMSEIDKIVIAFGRSISGIEFDAQDSKPSHLFFVLLAPEDAAGEHLKVLARLSKILKEDSFRESLLKAESEEEIYKLITDS
ncbi:PTS sugar transporter subunit IIA, partial [bacterium]|nr:PTS sugar transporter subunit IIA [bacterium]